MSPFIKLGFIFSFHRNNLFLVHVEFYSTLRVRVYDVQVYCLVRLEDGKMYADAIFRPKQ